MNGFSAEHKFEDYPIRDRRVVLHVRRRRWIDGDGHNRFSDLPLLYAKGTGYSDEFGAFFKKALDTYPVTANSVGRFLGTKGRKLERSYKDCLSDFRDWDQEGHAKEWVLFPNNMGTHLSIDETQLHDGVYHSVQQGRPWQEGHDNSHSQGDKSGGEIQGVVQVCRPINAQGGKGG